jgi:hypothetical protein
MNESKEKSINHDWPMATYSWYLCFYTILNKSNNSTPLNDEKKKDEHSLCHLLKLNHLCLDKNGLKKEEYVGGLSQS